MKILTLILSILFLCALPQIANANYFSFNEQEENIIQEDSSSYKKLSPAIAMAKNVVNIIDGFETSSSTTLTPQMLEILDKFVVYLKDNPNAMLRIEGHSDNQGTHQQNNQIAIARTNAVVNYFVSQGIAISRMYHRSRGATAAIADNNTAEGRAKNRRIEITILTDK